MFGSFYPHAQLPQAPGGQSVAIPTPKRPLDILWDFYNISTSKSQRIISDPPPMDPHAAELLGIADSEKGASEDFAPLRGAPGGVAFSQRFSVARLGRIPNRRQARGWGRYVGHCRQQPEIKTYETVCERRQPINYCAFTI